MSHTGKVSARDLDLIRVTDDPQEVVAILRAAELARVAGAGTGSAESAGGPLADGT